jgi:hypothetical protein
MWVEASHPTLEVTSKKEVVQELDTRPRVLGYSVMHTGTGFLTNLVAAAGFKVHHNHAFGDADPTHYGHGANSIFLPERQDLPLVIPVRHPYDVVETWWQRNLDLERLPLCYLELFEKQQQLDYLEFYVSARTEGRRLHQMQRLSEHLGLPEVPGYWLEVALTWNKVSDQKHEKPPYQGDKSFVDFAVEHYRF